MKVKNISIAVMALLFSGFVFTSCEKEDSLGESRLDTTEKPMNELDSWLHENYVLPYNIAVNYRWNENMVDNSRYMYPANPKNVKKVMEMVKLVWIDSYEEAAYTGFVRELSPKQFALVGGNNLNKDGSNTLGLADQGQRIVLFTVDLVNVNNINSIRQFVHTIQHEYVHILNQTVRFDKLAYGKITASGYDSNWTNYGDTESLNAGFITPYSRVSADEDFAEVAAAMLVDLEKYNNTVESISNPEGKAALRKKEELVVEYYKNLLKIDFYKLCEIADKNTRLATQLN